MVAFEPDKRAVVGVQVEIARCIFASDTRELALQLGGCGAQADAGARAALRAVSVGLVHPCAVCNGDTFRISETDSATNREGVGVLQGSDMRISPRHPLPGVGGLAVTWPRAEFLMMSTEMEPQPVGTEKCSAPSSERQLMTKRNSSQQDVPDA